MNLLPLQKQTLQRLSTCVAVEPVRQTLLSMALLTTISATDDTETWLIETAAQLTEEERRFHELLFGPLAPLLWRDLDKRSFPDYLAALQRVDANEFAAAVTQIAHATTMTSINDELSVSLAQPNALQRQIVDHLRMLWQLYFAKPWEKKSNIMSYMTRELNGRSWPTTSAGALISTVLHRPAPEWLAGQVDEVEQIIFVPSAYLQFQAAKGLAGTEELPTLWIFMWADVWFWHMRTEPIQRTEVLRAISALDDETRLQILEMLAASTELRAQEIIAQLEVSQSTVSRHLKQLVNAGFISEERAGDTNKLYRLQPKRIGEVTYSLTQLLSAENAQLVLTDMRLQQPAELRPFLDRDGLVTAWPAKRKGQEAVLAYLITKFSIGEQYTEMQVNELLKAWHTYNDPAYLRRCLVDDQLLKRTTDGAQYWRKA